MCRNPQLPSLHISYFFDEDRYPTQQQIDQLQKVSQLQTEKITLTQTGPNQAQFLLTVPAYGVAMVSVPN